MDDISWVINFYLFFFLGCMLLWVIIEFNSQVLPHIKFLRNAKYLRRDKFILFKGNEYLLEKGDYLIFECLCDTEDISILGCAGGAYYGHLQKWVMDSEDTKYMFGLKKYKTNGKHDNHISFFAKNVSEDGTYTTQKTFYAPFPMTFRLWIEKKVFEKWWYKKLADWSMNIYNRNLRINRKERERVGKLIRY